MISPCVPCSRWDWTIWCWPGRCISGSHRAHASYRVMNIAMAVGQAAGCMASEAAEQKCKVSELSAEAVRRRLTDQGCTLRGKTENK